MFNYTRLNFALNKRSLTRIELAEALGVTVRQVSKYLNGTVEPNIDKLAETLQLPASFFYGNDLPELTLDQVSFRSLSRTPKKLLKQAITHGISGFLLNDYFEQDFELAQADLPDYQNLSPEDAALAIRTEWGLGDKPIYNLNNILESKGIRIFSLPLATSDVDAFCTYHNTQPFIFLNTEKTAERSRFDAAHELGHLLRDRNSLNHTGRGNTEIEREANRFASAFLMPESALLPYKNANFTIDRLIEMKHLFGVSFAALAYRLHQTGMIGEWLYTRILCPQIASNGWRTKEPYPIKKEQSASLNQILTSLKDDGVDIQAIAQKLNTHPADITALMKGLVEPNLLAYRNLKLIK